MKSNRIIVDEVCKKFVDDGKLIEAGFASLRLTVISPTAPAEQIREMRMAFFAGAQHLFGAMMSLLDPGSEPTANDIRRMRLIERELAGFIAEFEKEVKK